ncbi:MAG: peptidoglycan-binding protein [Candidatus Nomurabacteria bacterium]|nr:peptidoglycan-binding protein [Candidatus Nomurabacteria bacterium]
MVGSYIRESYSSGNVTGVNNVGGLAGTLRDLGIIDSYSTSNVSGDSNVGGVVGQLDASTISNVYSTGIVNGNISTNSGGGLAGSISNASTVSNSFSTSPMSGFGLNFGALIGADDETNTITNNHFYDLISSTGMCDAVLGTWADCASDATDINYFKGNSTNAPFVDNWDFRPGQVWVATPDSYPTLYKITADDPANLFASGDGTKPNPFHIQTCKQFENINYYLSSYFILDNNLACSKSGNSITVGNGDAFFTGNLDGQNHTIDISLDTTALDNITGLFTLLFGASVSNLNISGNINSILYTGSLVGAAVGSSHIDNVHSSVNVNLGDNSGSGYFAGGLVGVLNSNSEIRNSSYTGNITLSSGSPIDAVGGIAGDMESGFINKSYSTGNINSLKEGVSLGIGGLAGYVQSGSDITESYSNTNVSSVSSGTGGLVGGVDNSSVTNAYATGNVTGSSNIGGLVGNSNNAGIQNTYATGSVTSTSGINGGGLIGSANNSTITNSFTTSFVSNFFSNMGGFIGDDSGSNTFGSNDWYNLATSGTSACSGDSDISASCFDQTDVNFFKGIINSETYGPISSWDFNSAPIWVATDGFYPTLYNISADDPILFQNGAGSAGSPYEITSCQELQNINTNLSAYYILKNDIDCSNFNFSSIGLDTPGFTGNFNGEDFAIDRLNIFEPSKSNVGLFSVLGDTAVVKNVLLTRENIIGSENVGGLAGYINTGAKVSKISTGGAVTGSGNNTGGLAGVNASPATIVNSNSFVDVSGFDNVGGLVGDNEGGSIVNSYATGNVDGYQNIGGLVGYGVSGNIFNSYATGNVSGAISVGGLVGDGSNAIITNTYATGSVMGNAYNLGTDNQGIAGFVGYSAGSAMINNSFTTSPVTFIYDGINASSTPLSNDTYVGNFIGNNDAGTTFVNDYYDQINGQQNYCMGNSTLGGQGVSDDANCNNDGADYTYFQGNASNTPLNNWNFTNIWNLNDTNYPILQQNSEFTGKGKGDKEQPYLITTCAEFEEMNNYDLLSGYFVLQNDLDCSSEGNNIMVGTTDPFTGTFDGLGHTIKINIDDNYSLDVGLFQHISFDNNLKNSGNINNLNISGTIKSLYETGALAGIVDKVHINNVSSSVNITIQNNNGWSPSVGGLVGHMTDAPSRHSTLSNSFNAGSIKIDNDSSVDVVGGLVGIADSNSTIITSYNIGDIDIQTIDLNGGAGGLVGYLNTSTISESYSSGNINGNQNIGGFIGFSYNSTIENSYSTTSVVVNSSGNYFGGFIGLSQNSTFTNDYAIGKIYGRDIGDYIGGFIGYSDSNNINNSFSAGTVYNAISIVAGFIGFDNNTVYNNSYFDSLRSGGTISCSWNNPYPSGCNFINLGGNDQNYFFNNTTNPVYNGVWDFSTIWSVTSTYPRLKSLLFTLGTGTLVDPYQISSCQQLQNMNIFLDAHYILTGDIDCSDTINWNNGHGFIPIGGSEIPIFTGSLDGQNYTIDGLYINNVDIPVGLFGVSSGIIKNINLTSENLIGNSNIGGLAGQNINGGIIINAHTNGGVSGTGADLGGLVGLNTDNNSVITNSSATVGIDSETNFVGGLVGENANNALISNSYVTGQISVVGDSSVGGLVGYLHDSIIKNSYANEQVVGYDTVGGLVGYAENNASILNSYSTGSVIANGNMFGYDNSNIGGLVGATNDNIKFYNSFTTSPVVFIYDGVNTQNAPLANDTYIGNFLGQEGSNIIYENNYFNKDSVGQNYCVGDSASGGLSGANRTGCNNDAEGISYYQNNSSNSPLDTWNFNTIWRTNVGDYPTLKQTVNFSGTGTGTEVDPYIIDSCNKFEEMNNPNISSGYFSMTTDLDCRSKHNNIMVGTDLPFDGHFSASVGDGSNYTLTVDINDTISNDVGVFQKLYNATINNFNIAGSMTSANETGSLAGIVDYDSVIDNVSSSININIENNNGYYPFVGGLVGYLTDAIAHPSHISNSSSSGSITASSTTSIGALGGLVGYMDNTSTIDRSHSTSAINVQTEDVDCAVGGLVGCMDNSTITKSYTTGSLTGIYGIGGLVGEVANSSITDSYSNRNIIGNNYLGGFVSYSYGANFNKDYSAGSLYSNNNGDSSGGFTEYSDSSDISNSFSAMTINGFNLNGQVGNFVGYDYSSNYDNNYVDKIKSNVDACISNNDTDCSVINAVDTIDVPDNKYFLNNTENHPLDTWNFASTWEKNESYPRLHIASFAGGSGTLLDPYQISSCQQFIDINSNLSAYYILNNDLDCSDNGNNIMIDAPEVDPFTGSFDGQNYSIDIKIDSFDSTIGLFRHPVGATIKNLNITGHITGHTEVLGSLAGKVESSTITNISSSAEVTSSSGIVGGLVGSLRDNSTLSNSYSIGAVFGDGNNIGGLVGWVQNSTVLNSYATGSVNSNFSHVGGLIGYLEASTVESSYSSGFISGNINNSTDSGSLVGSSKGGSYINNSFATGLITNFYKNTGGLVSSSEDINLSNDYYDQTNTQQSGCTAAGDISNCNPVNIDNLQPNYFLNNATSSPLDTWNFASTTPIWAVTENFTPTFLDNIYDNPKAPFVDTKDATNVNSFSATLNGSITNSGGASHFYFEYGTTDSYELGYAYEFTGISGTGNFSTSVKDLSQANTYHYRLCADNNLGNSCGNDVQFDTPSAVNSDMSSNSNSDKNSWFPDGPVFSSVVNQDTGEVYIGGNFHNMYQPSDIVGQGVPVALDTGLHLNDPQINGPVYASVSDNNGGWYIGGDFTSVGEKQRNNLAHIDANGNVDDINFGLLGVNGTVRALALSPMGDFLYVGGDFNHVEDGDIGHDIARLAKINTTTGTADLIFDAGFDDTEGGNTIRSLALNFDGSKIYAIGTFVHTNINTSEVDMNGITEFNTTDGSLDTSFKPTVPNVNEHYFYSSALSLDGTVLYVGGAAGLYSFETSASENSGNNLWDIENFNWVNGINALALSPNGNTLYAGGYFSESGDVNTHNYLVAFNTSDASVMDDFQPDLDEPVNSLVVSSDNNTVYAGGWFTYVKTPNVSRLYVAGLDATTGVATSFDPRSNDIVNTVALSSDNTQLFIGGDMTMINAVPRNNIAALDIDGALDTNFDPNVDGQVNALALSNDNSIVYAGGSFTKVNDNVQRKFIAGFDTSGNVTNFDAGIRDGNYVNTLGVDNNNLVYTGGDFNNISVPFIIEIPRNGLAVFNPDGSLNNLDFGLNGPVYSLALSKNNPIIYLAGAFSNVNNGVGLQAFSTTDGSAFSNFNPSVNNSIFNKVVVSDDDNTIYASTYYTSSVYSFDFTNRDATPGLFDLEYLGEGINDISLAPNQNTLYVSGGFNLINGFIRNYLASFTTSANITTFDPDLSSGGVNTISYFRNGEKMYVGGYFDGVKGETKIKHFTSFTSLGVVKATTGSVSATNIAQTSATLNGTVIDTGGEYVTAGFDYGIDTNYGNTVTVDGTVTDATDFTYDISSLTCGTTYYYRSFATNSAGTVYSSGTSFETDHCSPMMVVLGYHAGLHGNILGNPTQIIFGGFGSAVTAVADTGYHFVNWSDNSTDNPRSDNTNTNVTANFAINTYNLNYSAGVHGSISGTASQTVNYNSNGTQVRAVPASGYRFKKWSDNSTTNPRTDTNVTGNISVTASFELIPSNGGGGGGGSSGGSIRYLCTDVQATNYNQYSSNQSTPCIYPVVINTNNNGGGGGCSTDVPIDTITGLPCPITGGDTKDFNSIVTAGLSGYVFPRNITVGDVGEDVKNLQIFLNANGFILAKSGAGAPGHETNTFGSLTKEAVKRFQATYRAEILTPQNIKNPTGNFATFTRHVVNGILSSNGTEKVRTDISPKI